MGITITNNGLGGLITFRSTGLGGAMKSWYRPLYLLDNYPGAAAAYSLRRLNSSYSGAAIRVRRDSDNAESDIGFTSAGALDETALMTAVKYENYCTYSEDLGSSFGLFFSSITANSTTAPDGATTANKVAETANTGQHSINRTNSTFNLTTQYTFSVYVKAAERNYVILKWSYSTSSAYACFDLTTGLITQSGIFGTAQLINTGATSVGNGWWRLSITGYAIRDCSIVISNSGTFSTTDGSYSYAGTLGSGIYAWGAQLNLTSIKTYQKTTNVAYNGNGYVTTWYDQSGNTGRNATQTTATNQPRIVSAGVVDRINNKPSAYYNGSSTFLNIVNIDLSISFVFGVGIATANVSGFNAHTIFSKNSISNFDRESTLYIDRTGSQIIFQKVISASSAAVKAMDISKINLFTGVYYTNILAYVNGVSGTSVALRAGTLTNPKCTIGSSGIGALFLLGYIPEIVVYNSDQTTNRTQIEQNINQYYTIY